MGHYGGPHTLMAADDAVGMLLHAAEALGYEVIVPRAVTAKEVRAVRHVPQVVGWRYSPTAHGSSPCGCPVCARRGEIKGRAIRQTFLAEEWYARYRTAPYLDVLAELKEAADVCRHDPTAAEAENTATEILGQLGYRRAGTAEDLAFLLDHPSSDVVLALALALASYRGTGATALLKVLCCHPEADVREAGAGSLLEVLKTDALAYLATLHQDEAITRAITDYQSDRDGQ